MVSPRVSSGYAGSCVGGVMVMVVVAATEVVSRMAILWDIDSGWLWMFDDV